MSEIQNPQEQAASRRGEELVHAAMDNTKLPESLNVKLREIAANHQGKVQNEAEAKKRWFVLGGGFATACLVLIVVFLSTGQKNPSVQSVAALANRQKNAPAPGVDTTNPERLNISISGLNFPTWENQGWKATGTLKTTFSGRKTTSVIYKTQRGDTVVYTIVAGSSLPVGVDTQTVTGNAGIQVASFQKNGLTVITWKRKGRTCIVSATTTPAVKLADAVRTEV